MPSPLDRYRRDITSQCGEDGVIEHLLTLLPDTPKTCLEVGAGDGAHLSNTNTLWTQKGWRALLIEGVPLGVEMIEKRAAGNKNVTAVCAFITPAGESSIDAIIKRTNFPAHLGVLSLDIDSNDLEVLESLRDTTADIVVIEFNHEIPAAIDYRDLPGDVFFRHSATPSSSAKPPSKVTPQNNCRPSPSNKPSTPPSSKAAANCAASSKANSSPKNWRQSANPIRSSASI
jgi:hypothetical protein